MPYAAQQVPERRHVRHVPPLPHISLLLTSLSVLTGLLGEMDRVEGSIWLPKFPYAIDAADGLANATAYVAQSSWLEHASIRDNILFGSPYKEERYQATVKACALVPDFEILMDADLTEIGEKGAYAKHHPLPLVLMGSKVSP
jgi:predicted metal-dependent HD superfamily phosphohydrolase